MTHFFNVDEVKEETKIIASGFIRNCQSLFDNANPYYNIPESVIRIIISYFADIEYFEKKSDALSFNTDQLKVTKIDTGLNDAAYGHVCIDSNKDKSIHRWIFKIVEDSGMGDIWFGIDGSRRKILECYIGAEIGQYGIGCGDYAYDPYISDNDVSRAYGTVTELTTGDTITMELNCANKSLNYYANHDANNKFGYENICLQNKKYVMAVSLSYKNDCVALLEYKRMKFN